MRSTGLLFFCLLLSTAVALSQEQAGYHIERITTDNGLPSNGIKGLQWDESTGFLWIGTEAGIVRYNGLSPKTFTAEDEPHITKERVIALLKNQAGEIVTADLQGNIFRVERNRLRFIETARRDARYGLLLPLIAVSEKLHRHYTASPHGLMQLIFTTYLPATDTSVYAIQDSRLYYYSTAKQQPEIQHPSQHWQGGFTIGSTIFLKDDASHIYRYLSPTAVQPIEIIDAGTQQTIVEYQLIWSVGMKYPLIAKGQKIWQVQYSGEKLVAHLICEALPAHVFIRWAQYNEKRKILALGTDSKGVLLISKNNLETITLKTSPSSNRTSYYGQLELPNGNILTNEGHVLGKTSGNVALPVTGKFSLNLYNDGDSVLYYSKENNILGYDPLYRYDFKTGRTKTYSHIRGANPVMQRTAGQLYILYDDGIATLQGDSLHYVHYFDSKKPPLGERYDMQEISPGVLAIVTCRMLLRYTTATARMDTIFNAGRYCVRTVWPYKNYLFIGTYGNGLYAYKDGKIKALPLDKNKYLLYTHCFIKDARNNCWISTNKGLFKVPLTDLTDAVDKETGQLYYHYFGKADGMTMSELNGGCKPCAVTMKNGTVSFPSMDGLLWVNPETADVALPEGKIYLDEVMADSLRIDADAISDVKIPYGVNQLVFHFSFPSWCNRENIYVEYQLNGRGWVPIELDDLGEMRFGNLSHGPYTLKLRKLNGFGHNNYTYTEIQFVVETPWHRSLWFYLMGSLFFTACMLGIFRWRTRHLTTKQRKLQQLVDEKTRELQEKNKVLEKADSIKTRLISVISHDIVTPLKFLSGTTRNLLEKRTLMTDELQQETLQEIFSTSQDLQQLSTNILNWIKYQNENRRLAKELFSVHQLVNEVCRIFLPVARQKGLQILNEVDQELTIHQFREPLKILLHNLLSNAINFSEKGKISISHNTVAGGIELLVTDEGMGMTTDQINNILSNQFIVSSANVDNRKGNGLGYLIVKDLLKMLHGKLNISSQKNNGTTVEITIPDFAK